MKKEGKRLTAIDEWGQTEFENRGMHIAIRKYILPFAVVFFIGFGLFTCAGINGNEAWEYVMTWITMVVFGGGGLLSYIAGRRYWKRMSLMPQPIKLEKLPSVWWIFKRK